MYMSPVNANVIASISMDSGVGLGS